MTAVHKNGIRIEFDNQSLFARIIGIDVPDASWLRMRILIGSCGSESLNMGDDRIIELPWSDFRRSLQSFAQLIDAERMTVEYDDMSRKLIGDHSNDLISFSNASNAKISTKVDIPSVLHHAKFIRTLKDEQSRDACRMLELRHCANFSVPGSGKTSTLLAVHSVLRDQGILDKLLVVAPRNAFGSWEAEARHCFQDPSPKIERLTGGREAIASLLDSDSDVFLITYQQLPIVENDVLSFVFDNRVHLVLDESHRIKKGFPGIHYSAVARIADFAIRRDILTGTPMPQSVQDLIPQFDFLWPGMTLFPGSIGKLDADAQVQIAGKRIEDMYVRTTKGELGLPPPKLLITPVRLGPIQQELYDLVRSEAARIASGMNRNDASRFRALGRQVVRLLQVSTNPALVTADDIYPYELINAPEGGESWELLNEFARYERPAKIDYAIRRVRELTDEGKKVVVWTTFVRTVQLLESLLQDVGVVSIYGDVETGDETDANTREGRLLRFHEDDECKVLVANPAAGGEGISLHRVCHNAIYIDRTFNAAHYLQSVDRIHRLGLDPKATTVIEILLAENTIDSVVDSRLSGKVAAMASVLDDRDLHAMAYDPYDVVEENPGGIDPKDESEILDHLKESR